MMTPLGVRRRHRLTRLMVHWTTQPWLPIPTQQERWHFLCSQLQHNKKNQQTKNWRYPLSCRRVLLTHHCSIHKPTRIRRTTFDSIFQRNHGPKLSVVSRQSPSSWSVGHGAFLFEIPIFWSSGFRLYKLFRRVFLRWSLHNTRCLFLGVARPFLFYEYFGGLPWVILANFLMGFLRQFLVCSHSRWWNIR